MVENEFLNMVCNDRELVVIKESQVNPMYNAVDLYFEFYSSSNKSIFHVRTNMETYLKLRSEGTLDKFIPLDLFMRDIFTLI